jgi:GLPGLI family protein
MCIWRGRAYTAWFAPSIAYANGPEKFGGLPGLIVEIYSDGNEYYRRLKSFSKAEFSIPEPPVAEGNYEYMVIKAKEYYSRFVEQVTALDKVNPNCKDCKQSSEIVAIDLEFTYVL